MNKDTKITKLQNYPNETRCCMLWCWCSWETPFSYL